MRASLMILFLGLTLTIALAPGAEAIHTGWFAPDDADQTKNPFAGDVKAAKAGKKVFLDNCVKCHGLKGKGKGVASGGLQIDLPDFSNGEVTREESDGEWFWKVRAGQFEMPPFQLILKDGEIWKSITYIRTFAK